MHRDYYEILNVSKNANPKEIKKAFRDLALRYHPDKGLEPSEEKIKQIVEAYGTLSDNIARNQYDKIQESLHDEDLKEDDIQRDFVTISASPPPYSQQFQRKHQIFVNQFMEKPLLTTDVRDLFKPYETSPFHENKCETVFNRIDQLNVEQKFTENLELKEEKINPEIATTLFRHFLAGHYYSDGLTQIINYFQVYINNCDGHHKIYCQTLLNIFMLAADSKRLNLSLLPHIQKVTQYANQFHELPDHLALLFQDQYFRELVKFAYHQQWLANSTKITEEVLEPYNGQKQTRDFFRDIKEKIMLSNVDNQQPLLHFARATKLLLSFETFFNEKNRPTGEAQHYRALAYLALDWIHALNRKFDAGIYVNIFIRAGLYFQLASNVDNHAPNCMADEKLAREMYCIAFSLGREGAPNDEIRCITAILDYMAHFRYEQSDLKELIQALQHRANILLDMFPFYEPPKPCIDFLKHENPLLTVMQSLLQQLVGWVIFNETNAIALALDHDPASILYQAYEACVKGWYEKIKNPETENQIRLMLMEVLLRERGWDYDDIENNVLFHQTTLERDQQRWLAPRSMLSEMNPLPVNELRSVDGIEMDYKMGDIHILATPVDAKTADCFRALSYADIVEMIKNNIQAAIFSLDPIDPDKLFHPFNTMRFAPSAILGTQFLQTLLSTDYLLKFFTVGQEIQGTYPYQFRSLNSLTEHLPLYLKNVITDFHATQQSESPHRFWIEATSVKVCFDEKNYEENDKQKIRLHDVSMLVKKHKMRRDENGHLVDDAEDLEGWHCYLLTEPLKEAFDQGLPLEIIEQPALLFYLYSSTIRFLEDDKRSYFNVTNYNDQLRNFFMACKPDEQGKMTSHPASNRLLYLAIREITSQANKPHRFSPEYVFAQEFTRYYNEFALYFPEFRRLRELCRLVIVIRLLNGIQRENTLVISKLTELLDKINYWQNAHNLDQHEDKTDIFYQRYQEIRQLIKKSVEENFNEWRNKCSYRMLLAQRKFQLANIKNQIYIEDHFPYSLGNNIDNETYQNVVAYSHEDSEEERESARQQLRTAFLLMEIGNLDGLIESFLNDNHQPLANALARHDRREAKCQMSRSLENVSIEAVTGALHGDQKALDAITEHLTPSQFQKSLDKEAKRVSEKISARQKIAATIEEMGLTNPESPEVNLIGQCLWVPANLKHNNDALQSENHFRFVYGGVSVHPLVINSNAVYTNPNSRPINVSANSGGGSRGGGGGNGGSGNGGSGSGSGGGGSGPGRFTILANNASKAEVRTLLKTGKTGLTPEQIPKILTLLSSGRMDRVTLKLMNNGEARLACVRSGRTGGYQRMSFGINLAGDTAKLVQTAFDNANRLIRQAPEQAKNNLYDVKKWNVQT